MQEHDWDKTEEVMGEILEEKFGIEGNENLLDDYSTTGAVYKFDFCLRMLELSEDVYHEYKKCIEKGVKPVNPLGWAGLPLETFFTLNEWNDVISGANKEEVENILNKIIQNDYEWPTVNLPQLISELRVIRAYYMFEERYPITLRVDDYFLRLTFYLGAMYSSSELAKMKISNNEIMDGARRWAKKAKRNQRKQWTANVYSALPPEDRQGSVHAVSLAVIDKMAKQFQESRVLREKYKKVPHKTTIMKYLKELNQEGGIK